MLDKFKCNDFLILHLTTYKKKIEYESRLITI